MPTASQLKYRVVVVHWGFKTLKPTCTSYRPKESPAHREFSRRHEGPNHPWVGRNESFCPKFFLALTGQTWGSTEGGWQEFGHGAADKLSERHHNIHQCRQCRQTGHRAQRMSKEWHPKMMMIIIQRWWWHMLCPICETPGWQFLAGARFKTRIDRSEVSVHTSQAILLSSKQCINNGIKYYQLN